VPFAGCGGDGAAVSLACATVAPSAPIRTPPEPKRLTSLSVMGSKDRCIQRMPFHARADPLCARLDARQVQICGSGSGPRRSLGGPMASRRPAEVAVENQAARLPACQCGMPLYRTTLCHPDAAIAGPDGRPFVSRVLSRQPSRVTARSYRRRARLRPVRRRPLQRSEHETQSRQHATIDLGAQGQSDAGPSRLRIT
jgi:hypothetical protein